LEGFRRVKRSAGIALCASQQFLLDYHVATHIYDCALQTFAARDFLHNLMELRTMMTNFDEVQKASKENMDLAMASMAAMSKGVQAMALETQDYSKKAMETGSAAMEDLLAAKSLDKAVEVQSDYMKTAYEAFVGQATKVNEMFVDLAKETYKPYEGVFAKVGK
jgi:hypothetical protein